MIDKYSAGPESRVPSFLVKNCAGLTVPGHALGATARRRSAPGRRPARRDSTARGSPSAPGEGPCSLHGFLVRLGWRRPAHLCAGALACAVLLTGLFGAGSAFAQNSDITAPTANDDGSDTLWTATLSRREAANDNPDEHDVMLQIRARW